MINITPIKASSTSMQDAVVDYLMNTKKLHQSLRQHASAAMGYYHPDDAEVDTSRWGGKLAFDPDLDLSGKAVSRELMIALAQGFSPNGVALCQNAGEQPVDVEKRDAKGNIVLDDKGEPMMLQVGGHRMGYDITMSAPGGVDVLFALAEPPEQMAILNAHRKAAQVAMDALESRVETRRGQGGKDSMDVQGLIYSMHDHFSGRAGDPDLHTHVMTFGICKGEDGNWGTFESEELFRFYKTADQIYRNELAVNLQSLGYGIEQRVEKDIDGQETGRIWWGVAGISEELEGKYSKRRNVIRDYANEHNVDNQTANLATRKHKDEPEFDELVENWKTSFAAYVAEDPSLDFESVESLKGRASVFVEPKDNETILARLHENDAVFGDKEIIQRIGTEWSGRIRYEELMEKVETFKQEAGLIVLQGEAIHEDDRGDRPARKHREDRYTAPWMMDFEQEVLHRAEARKDEQETRIAPETTSNAIDDYEAKKGFKLTDEQRQAITHVTNETGGIAVLSGLAGTGKTTVSECYTNAFKSAGRNVRGLCIAYSAAKKLHEESGMECTSVAMMLYKLSKQEVQLSSKDVIVLDEAGMVPTRETKELMAYCDAAGAKLVLQGDTHQLQPVGAGSGMSLVKQAAGDVMLTEIRRQTKVEDRDTARSFYDQDDQGQIAEQSGVKSRAEMSAKNKQILAKLIDGQHLDISNDGDLATEQLVKNYLESARPTEQKLVIAHSRADVSRLNSDIRKGLKSVGEVSDKGDVVIQARDNRAKAWVDLPLAEGDRIRFGAKDDSLGVINGDRGRIEKIQRNYRQGGYDFTVAIDGDRSSDNRTIMFNHHEYNAIGHRYASTVHDSQGQGKQQVFHRAHVGMADNQSMLVAYTRQTEEYVLYASVDEMDTIKRRLGMDRLKANAVDAVKQDLPPIPGAPPPLSFDEAPHEIRKHKVEQFKEDVRESAQAIKQSTQLIDPDRFEQKIERQHEQMRGLSR